VRDDTFVHGERAIPDGFRRIEFYVGIRVAAVAVSVQRWSAGVSAAHRSPAEVRTRWGSPPSSLNLEKGGRPQTLTAAAGRLQVGCLPGRGETEFQVQWSGWVAGFKAATCRRYAPRRDSGKGAASRLRAAPGVRTCAGRRHTGGAPACYCRKQRFDEIGPARNCGFLFLCTSNGG